MRRIEILKIEHISEGVYSVNVRLKPNNLEYTLEYDSFKKELISFDKDFPFKIQFELENKLIKCLSD